MIRKVILLSLVTISFNCFSADYLITTNNLEMRKQISEKYTTSYKKGRVHVVSIKDFSSVDKKFSEFLKPVKEDEIYVSNVASRNVIELHSDSTELMKRVSTDRFRGTIEKLISFDNRYAGTEGNKEAANWIEEQFAMLGYATSRNCFKGWYYNGCNIIGEKKAASPTRNMIVVIGHFDTVKRISAGADDNSSGSAGVVELARILKDVELPFNVRFIAADAEEVGMIGSKQYVSYLQKNNETSNVLFALNLDMIGYNRSDVLAIETNKEHMDDANLMASIIRTISKYTPQINTPAWGSDHVAFLDKGISTMMPVQDWENHNPCYHKMCDTIDKVDFDFSTTILKTSLAYIIEKSKQ